jgi:hypothetical protein
MSDSKENINLPQITIPRLNLQKLIVDNDIENMNYQSQVPEIVIMDPNDKILDDPNDIFERDVSFRACLKKHAHSYNAPTPLNRANTSNYGTFPTFNPIMMP